MAAPLCLCLHKGGAARDPPLALPTNPYAPRSPKSHNFKGPKLGLIFPEGAGARSNHQGSLGRIPRTP